jgi:hypothetical protein
MKHKWHNEIKAWADGARIQYKPNNMLSFWETYPGTITPAWNNPQLQFRIFREWYENIPQQGRLCWVSDRYANNYNNIRIIVEYDYYQQLPFISKNAGAWLHAVPLTDDEIKQFLTQE